MEGRLELDASFARELLGWRTLRNGNLVPNSADSSSLNSVRIAAAILDDLGVQRDVVSGVQDATTGRPLELAVASDLQSELRRLDPGRLFSVSKEPRLITDFLQYEHLRRLDQLAAQNEELRITLGTDYLIRPDIVVALPGRTSDEHPFLHAVVSCKWTIRSDRVQNIRHEYNQLIKHRRERLPHLVTVTAEPLPTRLTSIARGTGEVDATYHIAFYAMERAMSRLRVTGGISSEQLAAWREVVDLGRVRPYSELAETIARW
ncbi:NgoMIV family type II restriction endonuclease [Agromyces sp. SYSU T00266]|uniref:NgoMIV family type II restriction endonuclease n=1 Tax=Agromyces zhanjiangensis TaxID=3158562 RepID=UPI003397B2B9